MLGWMLEVARAEPPEIVPTGASFAAESLSIDLPEVDLAGRGTLTLLALEGSEEPVGFVWSGSIAATVHLMPEDGAAIANRMSLHGASAPELGRGGALRTSTDTVAVLAPAETVRAWTKGLAPSSDRATGLDAEVRRLNQDVQAGLGFLSRLAADAALHAAGAPAADGLVVVDLRATERLWVVTTANTGGAQDSWITVTHDPLGIEGWDSGCGATWTLGRDPRSGFGIGLLGTWPCGAGEPRERVRVVRQSAKVDGTAHGADDVDLSVSIRVTFAAAGPDPVHLVPLDLAGLVAPGDAGSREVDVGTATVDGAEVDAIARGSTVWLAVDPTAEHTVELALSVRWPLVSPSTAGNTGHGSQPIYVLPYIPTASGSGPAELDVALIPGLELATSGAATVADGRARVTLPGGAVLPAIAYGKWLARAEPADNVGPATRILLFPSEKSSLKQFPPLLRTVVSYYGQLLPPIAIAELELFQPADVAHEWRGEAPHELLALQQATTYSVWGGALGAHLPNLTETIVAHEVAHQWFGGRLACDSLGDAWIAESFAQYYAELYTRAAYGADDADAWRAYDREACVEAGDDGQSVALTSAVASQWWAAKYRCGPTLLHALRKRIGDNAFFGAVHDLPAGPTTTDDMVRQLSRGADVEPFLRYWLDIGIVPTLSLQVDVSGQKLTGTVTSDVPYGILEVPVRVTGGGDPVDTWVRVENGEGTFTATGTAAELDPDDLMPIRKKRR